MRKLLGHDWQVTDLAIAEDGTIFSSSLDGCTTGIHSHSCLSRGLLSLDDHWCCKAVHHSCAVYQSDQVCGLPVTAEQSERGRTTVLFKCWRLNRARCSASCCFLQDTCCLEEMMGRYASGWMARCSVPSPDTQTLSGEHCFDLLALHH